MALGLWFLSEVYESPDEAEARHWLSCRAFSWDYVGGRAYRFPLRLTGNEPPKAWRAIALYLDCGTNRVAGRHRSWVDAREFELYGMKWADRIYTKEIQS